jgi:hypothetical protein
VLATIPANDDIRRKSASYEIIGRPGSPWGALFEELATNVADAPPMRPNPLTQDQLLGLFAADVVGRNVSCWSPPRSSTCVGKNEPSSPRSKWSTTKSDLGNHAARSPKRCLPNTVALEGDGGLPFRQGAMLAAARAPARARRAGPVRADYPQGPHDQPQSMCPAFGSLRVGLRMRRTATILSGSACCVYGLTFTSHFYGARRSVGYVPFNSETLVTGKLFEDIREAVHQQADPALYDAVVIINLCVPTASGVPLQLLPKEINGVRIIGIDVPGFGVPTHAEAKDVLAGAMLRLCPRPKPMAGPVQAPRLGKGGPTSRPSRCWARCSRPTR